MKKKIVLLAKAVLDPVYGKKIYDSYVKKKKINSSRRKTYIEWFNKQQPSAQELEKQRMSSVDFTYQPLLSILLPTYNTNPVYLAECIESVLKQTYPNWELCIADDASTSKDTTEVIRSYVKSYSNIKAVFSKENGHIAASSNKALGLANGEYVSLLDHDDTLPPNALYEVVKVINTRPEVDLIYTDEDKIDQNGTHIEPFFKPDWSPDFLNSCNMITHFATMKTSLMKKIGGFKIGTQGAQDWDLFLRASMHTDNIWHIPKILYHWRKSETSTAANADSKPYAYINQKRVLRDSIVDRHENAYVEEHPAALGFWRKRYVIDDTPLVSIIIPTKDNYEYIQTCLNSILEETTYPFFEIVIVDTGSKDKRVWALYDKIQYSRQALTVVDYSKQTFNFSRACNVGAEHAQGEYFIFLNNDTKVITRDWVQGLLEHAKRDSIGMVGARLLFSDNTIQHAGVVLSEKDIAFHPFYGKEQVEDIFNYIYIANIRNVSAVTAACSMISKKKFFSVNGFDEELPVTYNDVDLCLKLLKKGYLNLYTPYAELYHYESKSVGLITTGDRDATELNHAQALMRKKWGGYLKRDRYYNDNFAPYGPGYNL